MKHYFVILACLLSFGLSAQVGVNTTDPKASLHVVGKPTVITEADGIIAPRLTRLELINSTNYTVDQQSALVYVTTINGAVNTTTTLITKVGYYFFDGTKWRPINAKSGYFRFGEIQHYLVANDFDGWVKLDGRNLTALTVSQRAVLTSLGFGGTTLPNATDQYFSQDTFSAFDVSSSNTKTIVRTNLPDIAITTTANGAHAHSINPAEVTSSTNGNHTHTHPVSGVAGELGLIRQSVQGENRTVNATQYGSTEFPDLITPIERFTINQSGIHSHILDLPATNSSSSGAHTHSFNLNNNVVQQTIDVKPQSLSVNTFIYLGT